MNGFDALKIYEGETIIKLSAPTLTGMIAECREKLDSWLATFDRPSKAGGKRQMLRMVSFRPLKYELYLVPRDTGEAWTIL